MATGYAISECFFVGPNGDVLVTAYVALKNVPKLSTSKAVLTTVQYLCNTWDKKLLQRPQSSFKFLKIFLFSLNWRNFKLLLILNDDGLVCPVDYFCRGGCVLFFFTCFYELFNWLNPNRTVRSVVIMRIFLNFRGWYQEIWLVKVQILFSTWFDIHVGRHLSMTQKYKNMSVIVHNETK